MKNVKNSLRQSLSKEFFIPEPEQNFSLLQLRSAGGPSEAKMKVVDIVTLV